MDDAEHPSYLAAQIIPAFFAYRGLAAAPGGDPPGPASRVKFLDELARVGYHKAAAAGPAGRVVVLALAPDSQYVSRGPTLATLLNNLVVRGDQAGEAPIAEVLVVAPEEVTRKRNIAVVVERLHQKGGARFRLLPYSIFSTVIPQVDCVPHHSILSDAEAADLLARERLGLADLRVISEADPPVVWVGGRAGQIVRTRAPSDTAGEAYDYWRVAEL